MKRTVPNLPPPTAFFTLPEVAGRWRRQEVTTERLLRKFGVPKVRLTSKVHLYARADIERIEEQAKCKPPLRSRTTWTKRPPKKSSNGEKGAA
jgi:hypothetical protein